MALVARCPHLIERHAPWQAWCARHVGEFGLPVNRVGLALARLIHRGRHSLGSGLIAYQAIEQLDQQRSNGAAVEDQRIQAHEHCQLIVGQVEDRDIPRRTVKLEDGVGVCLTILIDVRQRCLRRHRCEVNFLKIDASFIADITHQLERIHPCAQAVMALHHRRQATAQQRRVHGPVVFTKLLHGHTAKRHLSATAQ